MICKKKIKIEKVYYYKSSINKKKDKNYWLKKICNYNSRFGKRNFYNIYYFLKYIRFSVNIFI